MKRSEMNVVKIAEESICQRRGGAHNEAHAKSEHAEHAQPQRQTRGCCRVGPEPKTRVRRPGLSPAAVPSHSTNSAKAM